MKQRIFVLLILFLFCAFNVQGQYPYYVNFNTNDGLPSNKIYNLLEDRYGFIWICTDQGVSRYDGVEFVNFSSKDGLPDNEILSMFEDKSGRIWFNSFSTEPSYYYKGKMYNAGNDSFLKRLRDHKPEGTMYTFIVQKNNSIAYMIEDRNSRWIVGKDIADIEVKYNTKMRAQLFQNILAEGNGKYHVLSPLEMVAWEKGDSVYKEDVNIWGMQLNYTKAPGRYTYGLRNFNGKADALRFDFVNGKKLVFPVPLKYFQIYDYKNTFILAADSSYARYNDSFNRVIENTQLPFRFDRMYCDRQENKWFCTADNGIYFIRRNAPFTIAVPKHIKQGILALEIGTNKLLMRTENNGLLQVDEKGNTKLLYYDPAHRRIRGFGETEKYIIIGTDGGIFRCNKDYSKPIQISVYAVKDIEKIGANELLIATASSTFIYRGDSLLEIHQKRTNAVWCLLNKTILVGGVSGIYACSETDGKFVSIKLNLSPLIDNSRIVDIKQDKQGGIWIATSQTGVFLYSESKGLKHFSQSIEKKDHFLSDVCFQIQVADDSSIWFANLGGITKVRYSGGSNFSDFKVQNFSTAEGIPGRIINSIAFWNKKVMLSTPDGVFAYTQFPQPGNEKSETLVLEVKVHSKLYYSDSIVLPYNENNLIIRYASSFINTGSAYRFRYRVKELNSLWMETDALQIPLLGLEHGNYTFEIASVNAQGQLGNVKVLHIHINTPWFKQGWFIGLVLLIIVLSFLYYFKLLRDKLKLSKNLTLFRLRILRAQMNPHFVFNALGNIQRLIHLKELQSANDYIGTLSSIMRKSLDYSDKEFIPLDKELEYTKSYLDIEDLRFSGKFECTIHSDFDETEMQNIYVPPLLMQPLAENAIKHAFKGMDTKGKLDIRIERINETSMRYCIEDNGSGFDADKTGLSKGYGLGIAKERVELLYKNMKFYSKFNIESIQGGEKGGTRITIELPILKDE